MAHPLVKDETPLNSYSPGQKNSSFSREASDLKDDSVELVVVPHDVASENRTECVEVKTEDLNVTDQTSTKEPPSDNSDDGRTSSGENSISEDKTVDSVDVTPNKDGGVIKQLISEGIGDETPEYGYTVSIRYKGYIVVGSSVQPLPCKEGVAQIALGKGTVVPGLELGICSMKRNEVAVFIIQPSYGYGDMGIPKVIPPYSVLCYEVELLDWKFEDLSPKKDDGILRKVIQKGEGSRFPNEGALVKIHVTGYHQGKVFEVREAEFILGEGTISGIPEGVETALLKFRLNEESMLYLKPQYTFDVEGTQKYGIPPDGPLEYKVKLISFEKAKDVWEMNSDEKYEKSVEARLKGVNYFKEGHYKVALRQFKKIISCLEKEPGVSPESEKSRNDLLIAGYSNSALCFKKLENYIEAIKACDKVLEMDPENEKALYQRGQCRMHINDCDEALEDFQKLLKLKPGNTLCKKSVEICRAKKKQQHLKDKAVYNNMFDKFAKQGEGMKSKVEACAKPVVENE